MKYEIVFPTPEMIEAGLAELDYKEDTGTHANDFNRGVVRDVYTAMAAKADVLNVPKVLFQLGAAETIFRMTLKSEAFIQELMEACLADDERAAVPKLMLELRGRALDEAAKWTEQLFARAEGGSNG